MQVSKALNILTSSLPSSTRRHTHEKSNSVKEKYLEIITFTTSLPYPSFAFFMIRGQHFTLFLPLSGRKYEHCFTLLRNINLLFFVKGYYEVLFFFNSS